MQSQLIERTLAEQGLSKELQKRFWGKVDRNGPVPAHRPELGPCWVWTGETTVDGYGRVYLVAKTKKRFMAHRAAWMMSFAPIPDRLLVLHKCDNPPCVNPEHLFLGTFIDNNLDMLKKGRAVFAQCCGENGPNAKLTWMSVRDIRSRYAVGATKADLAKEFGVTPTCIYKIVSGVCWKEKPEWKYPVREVSAPVHSP